MTGATIDAVIARLDGIVDRARRERSRLGYFAVLYRAVTVEVRAGLRAGRFEDPARMERLDVLFASRYLDALDRFQRGERAPGCWEAAFRAAQTWQPIVLQHLLLGINAHINYDLGIACAHTAAGADLARLRPDFDAIGAILASLTDRVQDGLTRVWPTLRVLDVLGGQSDEAVLDFSLVRARAAAWAAAERLVTLDPEAQARELERLDSQAGVLAKLLLRPGAKLTLGLLAVRLQEQGDPNAIIDGLL